MAVGAVPQIPIPQPGMPANFGAVGGPQQGAPVAGAQQQWAQAGVRRPGGMPPAARAAGNLPTIGQARAQAAQQQPLPDTGLLGRIKSGFRAFGQAIARAFTRPPAPPPVVIPQNITVTCSNLPGRHGVPTGVTIDKAQYEQMIMSLPKSQRAAAVGNLSATLAGRIDRGINILNQVRAGANPLPQADLQNVSDLMLGLYAIAADNNSAFTNGSFQVVDPQGRLADWLDSSNDIYPRSSSHLKAYQGDMIPEGSGGQHVNMQRGIDIPEGVQTGLPNGHKTLVYGTVPGSQANTVTGQPATPRRIFLKTESAGCRISFGSKPANALPQGKQARSIRLSDIPEAIRHGLSFLQTRGQQGIGNARKEHFPSGLATAYKDNVKLLKTLAKRNDQVGQDARTLLESIQDGKPASGGGACVLRRNLEAVQAATLSKNGQGTPFAQADPQLQNIVQNLFIALNHNGPQDHIGGIGGQPNIRLGNEVIID